LIEQIPSGIPGLDEMLRGGFPKGRTILVIGGPGSGKTIFGVQFLIKGAYEFGENGLFLSFDERKEHLYSEMEAFGWRLSEAESERKLAFVDAYPRRVKGDRRLFFEKPLSTLRQELERISAKRIVVDPITSLILQYPNAVNRRNAVVNLIDALNDLGLTSVITLELRSSGFDRSVQLEEYLANGVIVLQTVQVGKSLVKTLHVEKMRGIDHDDQPRPYRITEKGIEVYAKETIF